MVTVDPFGKRVLPIMISGISPRNRQRMTAKCVAADFDPQNVVQTRLSNLNTLGAASESWVSVSLVDVCPRIEMVDLQANIACHDA